MAKFISELISPDSSLLKVQKERITALLGVPSSAHDPYLDDLIVRYLDISGKLCLSRASYCLVEEPLFFRDGTMVIEDETFRMGRVINAALKKSTHLVFFMCTIGPEVSDLSRQLIRNGDALEGLIVDLVGSELAEALADLINKRILNDMKKKGLFISNRYSPGYCGWQVSEQEALFRILPGEITGISLNGSALMQPVKSVSGVIGAGPEIKFRDYSCSSCPAEQCIYRDKNSLF